jgi:hypothetical protein
MQLPVAEATNGMVGLLSHPRADLKQLSDGLLDRVPTSV